MEKTIFSKSHYKVLVTIKVRESMSLEVEADRYTKLELAQKDANYITETQGLKTRVVQVHYKEIEIY